MSGAAFRRIIDVLTNHRGSPGGRGTLVTATIAYGLPAGAAGKLVAKLLQHRKMAQARSASENGTHYSPVRGAIASRAGLYFANYHAAAPYDVPSTSCRSLPHRP